MITQEFICLIWIIRAGYSSTRFVVRGAGVAVYHRGITLDAPVYEHELFRMAHRQGAQHDGIHEAVDGGICANAESERKAAMLVNSLLAVIVRRP